MIGRRTIITLPDCVAESRTGATYIRMRIVPVHAPSLQNSIHKTFVTGTPDVINDFISFIFDQRLADFRGDVVQNLVPRNSFPFASAAFSLTPHRVKNAVSVVNLINRRRTFRAVAPATPRMIWIAFKFA